MTPSNGESVCRFHERPPPRARNQAGSTVIRMHTTPYYRLMMSIHFRKRHLLTDIAAARRQGSPSGFMEVQLERLRDVSKRLTLRHDRQKPHGAGRTRLVTLPQGLQEALREAQATTPASDGDRGPRVAS